MKTDYDLIIAGGGMVGSALACALGNTDLKIALLEGAPLERIRPGEDLDIASVRHQPRLATHLRGGGRLGRHDRLAGQPVP
ncbi:MAG: hypothetical protein MZV65_01885 [Chromatiales bacterium]|nr:hypothetical protein [Chromatiales bacterium]